MTHLLLAMVVLAPGAGAKKSDLVYSPADDFGHHDIGFNGGDQPTPVLDALVSQSHDH